MKLDVMLATVLVTQFSSAAFACDANQVTKDIQTELVKMLSAKDLSITSTAASPGEPVTLPDYIVSFKARNNFWLGIYKVDQTTCKPELLNAGIASKVQNRLPR